jgi:hypothetical protein
MKAYALILTATLLCLCAEFEEFSAYNITHSASLEIGVCPVLKLNVSGEARDLDVELISPDGKKYSSHIFNSSLFDGFEEVSIKMEECAKTPKPGEYKLFIRSGKEVLSALKLRFSGPAIEVRDVETKEGKLYVTVFNKGDLPVILHRIVVENKDVTEWLFMEPLSPMVEKKLEFNIGFEPEKFNLMLFSENKLVARYEG